MQKAIISRIQKLEEINGGNDQPKFHHVFVEGNGKGIIPDQFNPERDYLYITVYEDKDGNPKGKPALMWQGKPYATQTKVA